jgi:hypothetical protein
VRIPKHLPFEFLSQSDRDAFQRAYRHGQLFDDDGGIGAHYMPGTRRQIETSTRRYARFLYDNHPDDLRFSITENLCRERIRVFVDKLTESYKPISISIVLQGLYYAARFIDGSKDWRWLLRAASRLQYRNIPEDRFPRLIPPRLTLDFGMRLMDEAARMPEVRDRVREMQFRDGLIITVLTLWPIRRRSLAALTIGRHLQLTATSATIFLFPEDMKSKVAESCVLHSDVVQYLHRYLREIRPRLAGDGCDDGLWVGKGKTRRLSSDRLYAIVRKRSRDEFGKPTALHDYRRAAATYLAMDAPDKVSLIPGVLQLNDPEVGEKYYNLAKSITANRRVSAAANVRKERLRFFVAPVHGSTLVD